LSERHDAQREAIEAMVLPPTQEEFEQMMRQACRDFAFENSTVTDAARR
jgi:hypothetical protein